MGEATDQTTNGGKTSDVGPLAGKVVTFGEAMLRLSPPGHERIERSLSLNVTGGGAELNTAVGLACLEIPSAFVTVLPNTPLGRWIARSARAHGVDDSQIRWVSEDEGRTGLYFLEEATDPRPSAVTYDRANSAAARMQPGAFDWPTLLRGATAFHLSGITPAIGEGARAESLAAVRAAKALGVPVAFDLNYRSKLWSEADARACFQEIAPLADILFSGRGGLRTFFDLDGSPEVVLERARKEIGVRVAAMPRKKNRGSRGIRLASLAQGPAGEIARSDWIETEIVDRLGGGDAFAAGFIAGYLEAIAVNPEQPDLTRACALGSAASALKHTMPGDFLSATRAEIEAAAAGAGAGVLQR